MGRFATREDEVDDLFRLGVFTDLYRVVRQGVRAGVESYSIKRLEPLCGYGRRVDLAEATASLIALEAALEDGTAAGDLERRRVVAGYNEDDCRATLALRDWLEERRSRAGRAAGRGAAAAGLRGEAGCPGGPRGGPDQVGAAGRRFRGNAGGAGAGAAGRPDRLAPARGQAGLVAILLPAHAEPGRTDRRAGRAGRAQRRRGGRAGQEVGGAAVPLPGAGTQVLRRRHSL